ncbi:MAG: N-6 DNA methylase, partial [Bacteroidota bacterium]
HNNPTAVSEIKKGNTLASPLHLDGESLKRFDFVVANPPFSLKSWTNGFDPDNDPFGRFYGYGIPPAKNGDYAFLLHIIRSLKSTGKAAVILPHGVLFRGNAEAAIRTNLLQRGLIKGIIGLPANLFYGTGIPACIIVIDKEGAENRDSLFMIDASKGFIKDGNKNRLRAQDIHKMVDVFNKRQKIARYARMVPIQEIIDNEYNLNIPRYIDTQEEEDIQDLEAHLRGGIPKRDVEALNAYWEVYPSLKDELFAETDRPHYLQLAIDKAEIKNCIFEHPEFVSFQERLASVFAAWQDTNLPHLLGIHAKTHPGNLIHLISEDLLARYSNIALIDKYDVYQHLLDYWEQTMKDDIYILLEDGWKAELTQVKDKKGKPKKGEFECELIPEQYIIMRYFAEEQSDIQLVEQRLESHTQELSEIVEEYAGEEGLLVDALTDTGKLTKASVSKRQKEIKKDPDAKEEQQLLTRCLDLFAKESHAKKQLKEANLRLKDQVLHQYEHLNEDEVKSLVVEDKWLSSIQESISLEIDGISQRLGQRIKELADRYEAPLPQIEAEVQAWSQKVALHLQKMGLSWG